MHAIVNFKPVTDVSDVSFPDQSELLTQLNALPVRVDTLRVKTIKAELERKLSEIEDAIKIFSRPKVFVKVDD